MTNPEFSSRFDIFYNNIMSNAAPGIDEYEKSVFLTKAQDEILKNYFNPKGNKYQEGFDDSVKRQVDFSNLISVGDGTLLSNISSFDSRAKVYKIPEDVFLIINEAATTNTGVKQVIPINFNDYTRLMSKPYKEPLKSQIWRLVAENSENSNILMELIPHSNEEISKYSIRYVRRPRPIILIDLQSEYGNVSINGVSTSSECELNPIIHEEILQRAVELAKVAYTGTADNIIQVGQRAE